MSEITERGFDRTTFVTGACLAVLAGVTAWDASKVDILASYGVGPAAMSYGVAAFLAILAAGHFVQSVRGVAEKPDAADGKALMWIGGGLAALLAAIAFDGGFIAGSTFLFAMTARAFGRRTFLVDVLIGFALGLAIFLLFNNVLELTLPEGPLERLL